MKTFYCLLCGLILNWSFANSIDGNFNTDDPVALSKKVIAESPKTWEADTKNSILSVYSAYSKLGTNDDKYLLLESPNLAFDFFQGSNNHLGDKISKGLLLEILNQALNSPETVTSKLAKATINKGLSEYQTAYSIAERYQSTEEISLEESLKFLENRYGYSKLDHAKKLMDTKMDRNISAVEEKNKKKVLAKIKEIEKKYPDQIDWVDALPLLEEWYRLLEEGLWSRTAVR